MQHVISARDLKNPEQDGLAEKTEILINPSRGQLTLAMKSVERGCRKYRMQPDALSRLYAAAQRPTFHLESCFSVKSVPDHYRYPMGFTSVTAARLLPDLVGFVVTRASLYPGQHAECPVYDLGPGAPGFEPLKWRNSVLQQFWTELSDEQIAAIDFAALSRAVMLKAELQKRSEAQRRASAKALQLLSHVHNVRPVYATELSSQCQAIAAELTSQGRSNIPWRVFKQRWPGLADRHKSDFLHGLNDQAELTVPELKRIVGEAPFFLTVGLWTGPQRVTDAPQLVFRVNVGDMLLVWRAELGSSTVEECFRDGYFAGHPGGRTTVGWLRVHVDDDRKLVFIDEIQSDVLEQMRTILKSHPKVNHVYRELRSWHLHGVASVHRWATLLGYRLAMHSKETLQSKPGASQSERKWQTYYASVLKRLNTLDIAVGWTDA